MRLSVIPLTFFLGGLAIAQDALKVFPPAQPVAAATVPVERTDAVVVVEIEGKITSLPFEVAMNREFAGTKSSAQIAGTGKMVIIVKVPKGSLAPPFRFVPLEVTEKTRKIAGDAFAPILAFVATFTPGEYRTETDIQKGEHALSLPDGKAFTLGAGAQ